MTIAAADYHDSHCDHREHSDDHTHENGQQYLRSPA